eukprot:NODE_22068_length_724_cov_3.100503.p3 GENE.NODE_22068_length_724_cov_3.100503~~NODE_22068_length_724_cov_3.100503.p3  ORF type:complete len:148 (+),score=26.98 NODE_22068_length_724_cov_3.100503:3-446(+)
MWVVCCNPPWGGRLGGRGDGGRGNANAGTSGAGSGSGNPSTRGGDCGGLPGSGGGNDGGAADLGGRRAGRGRGGGTADGAWRALGGLLRRRRDVAVAWVLAPSGTALASVLAHEVGCPPSSRHRVDGGPRSGTGDGGLEWLRYDLFI